MSNRFITWWKKRWVRETAFVVLVAVIFLAVRTWQQRTLVEGPAPALQAVQIGGQPFDLADWRGRPVLVYFWATWCPVCKILQGSIDSLAGDYRVISVALQSGSPSEVAKYLQEHALRVPVINDPDGAIAARWGVRATPTLFVLDGDGLIRFREIGLTSETGLRMRLWFAARRVLP